MTAISRRYELQASELRSIFDEYIRPRYFADSVARVRPTAVVVGGQSGAGLAAAAARFRRAYPPSRMPPVIGDEVRVYHPRYLELTATQPGLAVEATAQAAVEWARMAVDYAGARGFSLILTDTLRKPGMVLSGLRRLHEAGFHTQMSLLSVPPHVSRLATVQRFGNDHRRTSMGVWTPLSFHEAEFAGVENMLSARTLEAVCDRLSVYSGDGAVLAQAKATAAQAEESLSAVRLGRSARMAQPEAEAWLRAFHVELTYLHELDGVSEEALPMLGRLLLDAHSVLFRAHPRAGVARSEASALLADAMKMLPQHFSLEPQLPSGPEGTGYPHQPPVQVERRRAELRSLQDAAHEGDIGRGAVGWRRPSTDGQRERETTSALSFFTMAEESTAAIHSDRAPQRPRRHAKPVRGPFGEA